MKKTISVKVGSKQKAAQEFIHAWHAIGSSKKVLQDEKLYFESAEVLLKTLTQKRLELLRSVRQEKKTSIRALAKLLKRDYKNVHQDTQILEKIGLIQKTKDGNITVPWETIITEISMNNVPAKRKNAKKSKNGHFNKRATG